MDAADKITVACPICRTRYLIGLQHAGKVVRCRCGAKIQVPELAKRAGTLPRAAKLSPVEQPQPVNAPLPLESPGTARQCPKCHRRLPVVHMGEPQACRCPCGQVVDPSSPPEPTKPPKRDLLEADFAFDFDSPNSEQT